MLARAAPGAITYLEQRAARIWPALDLGAPPENGLLAWTEEASREDLATMLVRCCAEGRQFVEGRNRPSGRASAGKLEPIILGIAERSSHKKGKTSSISLDDLASAPVPARPKAGRSRIDGKVDLIVSLANDWRRVTGNLQTGGRSEDNPLAEFIISVFDWAKIDGVEYALRVYWSEMKTRKAKSKDIPRCDRAPEGTSE